MRRQKQRHAISGYHQRVAILMLWCLSMGVLPCLSGCMLDYSIKKDGDPNTAFDTGTASESISHSESDSTTQPPTVDDTETESESETSLCPSALEFKPPVQFTETVVCAKPAQPYTDSCPDGQAIIGFKGFLRSLDLVQARMRAICGIPSVKAVGNDCVVERAFGEILPVRGTSGEEEWTRICPDNDFLMGFKAWTGDNIDKVIFRCAPLLIALEGSHFVVTRGSFTDLELIGKDDGAENFQQDCPSGQIATTTIIQADNVIRAIGLGCQSPSAL